MTLPETEHVTEVDLLNLPMAFPIRHDRRSLDMAFDELFREQIGGKGHGLLKMYTLDAPVPDGFILTTDAYRTAVAFGSITEPSIVAAIDDQIAKLETATGCILGDSETPLIFSARSSAQVSMPGAMETFLNGGITDSTIGALVRRIGHHAAYSSYLSLIRDVGIKIFNIDTKQLGVICNQDETVVPIEKKVEQAKRLVLERAALQDTGSEHIFIDARLQMSYLITGVMNSWNSADAQAERERKNLSPHAGTAVIIQQMMMGNDESNPNCGSGVMITHNNVTYLGAPLVDFRASEQGDRVVADASAENHRQTLLDLPAPVRDVLAEHLHLFINPNFFLFPQDVEFTVANIDGELRAFFLQTRDAPLSNVAALRHISSLVHTGHLTEETAIRLISPHRLRSLQLPDLDPSAVQEAIKRGDLLARGLDIAPGSAHGILVRSIEEAKSCGEIPVVLAMSLTQQDIRSMPSNVVGIIGKNGAVGSHLTRYAESFAAKRKGRVVPIVFGITIDADSIQSGETVTVDGTNGLVFRGTIPVAHTNGNRLLLRRERRIVNRWLQRRAKNPWAYTTAHILTNRFDRLVAPTKAALKTVTSHKAGEIIALKCIIPSEIRMVYEPLTVSHDPREINYARIALSNRLHALLDDAHDVTVRTAHHPPRPNEGPYAVLTSHKDIQQFLTDPEFGRHGGLEAFFAGGDLSELIVGQIPKDKMNKAFFPVHCSWTLRVSAHGELILQIHPFSPLLRDQNQATAEDLITYTIDTTLDGPAIEKVTVVYGAHLTQEGVHERAMAFGTNVFNTIFEWMNTYELNRRLIVAAQVFPTDQFCSAVLCGQARINDAGDLDWCRVYDLNLDPILEQTQSKAQRVGRKVQQVRRLFQDQIPFQWN